MITAPKRKSVVFATLGVCLVAVAVALNVSWIVINWREGLLLALGLVLFPLVIAGLVLNTIFLVREVRRSEQHDAFINAVTHELKTPVASIRLYLETLERRELPQEKRREFYRVMIDDSRPAAPADRAGAASRAHQRAGGGAPPGARRSAGHWCASASIWRACAITSSPRRSPTSDRLGDPQQATVLGDPDELKAALSNLLDNAIKYSNNGVHVEVELPPVDERRVAVRVTDQGIGISPAELKRIFRRFYRIPEAVAMRIKGTGLGLFIVSSIARKHGGRVFAESAGPRPRQHVHAPASGGAARMSRILVVEDEQHLADGLRFNLEAESYDAEVVDTGEAALDRHLRRWRSRGPRGPRRHAARASSGFDVVRRLRESGRYLPVLLLTARGHADDVVRGFEAGADDYLPKPFDLSVLIARITALLRRQAWGRRSDAAPEANAPSTPDRFEFAGRAHRFRRARDPARRSHRAADAHGGQPAAVPRPA